MTNYCRDVRRFEMRLQLPSSQSRQFEGNGYWRNWLVMGTSHQNRAYGGYFPDGVETACMPLCYATLPSLKGDVIRSDAVAKLTNKAERYTMVSPIQYAQCSVSYGPRVSYGMEGKC